MPTGITAWVNLRWADGESTGLASGPEKDRAVLIAQATLRALESHKDVALTLLGTSVTGVTTSSVAISVVEVGGSGDRYAGSAMYRNGEEDQSVARSVLDALNRLITRLP